MNADAAPKTPLIGVNFQNQKSVEKLDAEKDEISNIILDDNMLTDI